MRPSSNWRARLAGKSGMDKLTTTQLDLADFGAATALMAQHDVIVAALPNVAIPAGIRAAAAAGVPWVDLSWPTDDQMARCWTQSTPRASLSCPAAASNRG
ncbi:MAG: hypothetical protein R2854_17050 [Caldilineaceae bacterium]